jgi:hypothetical protein
VVKLFQIIPIVNSKSAVGLDVTALYFEVCQSTHLKQYMHEPHAHEHLLDHFTPNASSVPRPPPCPPTADHRGPLHVHLQHPLEQPPQHLGRDPHDPAAELWEYSTPPTALANRLLAITSIASLGVAAYSLPVSHDADVVMMMKVM